MASWYSSWFSSLPTFDFVVPSNIQRRFFSFLLRRTLGHFLKPGQLDLHQIDSQLGSGTVHVKDLELDGQAINQLLVGLPVFLYDGFISGVTARIPFPNPLSSSVGFHVQSLNLTFQVTPEQSISPTSPSFPGNSNLADSVVSVAETFIHDELTPREEATLRQTFKPSADSPSHLDETENLPGGFNPLVNNPNTEEAHNSPHGDDDPTGVSVFATLIERLLAKFEFSAVDTKVTIIYPGRASFTLSVSEIAYHTDPGCAGPKSGPQPTSIGNEHSGQIRTVTISGLRMTSRDLRVTTSSPTVTRTLSPVSFTSSRKSSPRHDTPLGQSSRNSSSSSLDEDVQLMMSQSIAMLPPSSPPLSSIADSMYQSAISTAQTQIATADIRPMPSSVPQITDNIQQVHPHSRLLAQCQDHVEDVLLSFGSQPMVFSLQTPSRRAKHSEQNPQAGDSDSANAEDLDRDTPDKETLQLTVTIGTLACAFRSSDLRVLLDIAEACIPKAPTTPPVPRKEASSELPRTALCLEASVALRGIVVIALPEPATGEVLPLDAFYERPLLPPRLPHAYLRLFVDALSISSQLSTFPPDLPVSGISPPTLSVPSDQSIYAKMLISDISLFTFHAVSSVDDQQIAAPILITDPYLPTLPVARHHRPLFALERPQDIRLPEFEAIDWTQAKFKRGSAKLSTWRSRNRAVSGKADNLHTPSRRPHDLPSSPNPFISSPLSEPEDKSLLPPVIEVSGRLALPSGRNSHTVDVKIAPLHFFLDLGMIFKDGSFMRFVEDITSAAIFTSKKSTVTEFRRRSHEELNEDSLDGDKGSQARPMSARAREREAERKRLEALVLEDLSLDMDYRRPGAADPKPFWQQPAFLKRKKAVPSDSILGFRLMCPMIRVETRCLSPPSHPPRSGCLLFDLRGLSISNDPSSTKSSLRFCEGTKSPPPRSSDTIANVILSVCVQEILAAYSLHGENMARTFVIVGFLPAEVAPDMSMLLATEAIQETLPLSIVLGRPSLGQKASGNSTSKLSMTIDVPLVNVVVDKAVFDGLQYWADDMAQLIAQRFTNSDNASGTLPSRNPSLIGSRYFAQPRRSATDSMDERIAEDPIRQHDSEIAVKVGVSEVLLRFIVPRNGEPRPLDMFALDVDALIELKPEGKDESVVTAAIMDLRIVDTSNEGDYLPLVQGPTRSLSSVPRPPVKCRITSLAVPETAAKETRIRLSLWGLIVEPPLDANFGNDLAAFAKAPPGVFESVVPSECTRVAVVIVDVSVHLHAPGHPGALAVHFGEVEFSTELVGSSSESAFKLKVSSSHFFLVDSIQDALESTGSTPGVGVNFWKGSGYALIAEISQSQLNFRTNNAAQPPDTSVVIERIGLRIHLCADTMSALTSLISNMTQTSKDEAVTHPRSIARTPNTVSGHHPHDMTASLDEHAFKLIPEVGSTADMISDDLPANQDYLDASFGAAAGLRELRDDDFEDFDTEEQTSHDTPITGQLGIVSNVGGETIRILKPFSFLEHYFETIPPDAIRDADNHSDTTLRIRIHNSDVVLFLHDGFDWPRTRKIIEKEVKEMRKRLARIRQLVATGQTQEPLDEATSATLFNSFHIGLEQDLEDMDTDAIIAAIDEELDTSVEIGAESSWQSLHPASPGLPQVLPTRVHGKRLTRSKGSSIEIRLEGLNAEIDNYRPGETLVSRSLILVRDIEILDHIKTSTWKKFLTDMRSDSRGNVRETDSNMARVELLSVRPSPSHPAEEARLRAKILPLRLYVDQDALDFFKKFFAFQDPESPSAPEDGERKDEIYFQHAEVFPVDIKLDYKPRRVDYRALRNGRTIELMNFFHFDGAEMTLRHLTLNGITGWVRFFDTLNDLWTPDVKATQLVDVISGVSPIRSVVNVGSGVADLILLPIAQYKKDGRVVRGVQKGTKAFVQSTAMEAIKLGARLATGTQVILEQAESVLGGQFKDSITAEALQIPYENEGGDGTEEDLISRYAAQPAGLKEGVQSAYRSLQRNLLSAAQTILAVPMEVYERSGDEGAVRAVVRAVPIAVLKPMIGASEAVSKTLMGLHNTLDPNVRLENEAKYKHR